MSQRYATRIYKISRHTVTPSSAEPGQLTIGSYNIAHGRGAVKDAKNWQYRTKIELVSHLEAIALQLREAKADILILN